MPSWTLTVEVAWGRSKQSSFYTPQTKPSLSNWHPPQRKTRQLWRQNHTAAEGPWNLLLHKTNKASHSSLLYGFGKINFRLLSTMESSNRAYSQQSAKNMNIIPKKNPTNPISKFFQSVLQKVQVHWAILTKTVPMTMEVFLWTVCS